MNSALGADVLADLQQRHLQRHDAVLPSRNSLTLDFTLQEKINPQFIEAPTCASLFQEGQQNCYLIPLVNCLKEFLSPNLQKCEKSKSWFAFYLFLCFWRFRDCCIFNSPNYVQHVTYINLFLYLHIYSFRNGINIYLFKHIFTEQRQPARYSEPGSGCYTNETKSPPPHSAASREKQSGETESAARCPTR